MSNRRERPRCRKEIEKLMREKGWTLEEMATKYWWNLSDGLRIQVRKMLEEEGLNPDRFQPDRPEG